MSPDIEFPGNRISHDCTGDISRHLCDGALQLIQHGLHGFKLHQCLILQRQEKKGFTVLSIQPFLENSNWKMQRIYKLPPTGKVHTLCISIHQKEKQIWRKTDSFNSSAHRTTHLSEAKDCLRSQASKIMDVYYTASKKQTYSFLHSAFQNTSSKFSILPIRLLTLLFVWSNY